ncbi:MAG: hypothetical protein PW843_03865 [Azospirillaceae bacterium]|nr:hypothetical protein [Azospirillaceae bacterium]
MNSDPVAQPPIVTIECQRQGGIAFPMARPRIAMAVTDLPAEEQAALRDLVQAANVGAQPTRFPGPGHPDAVETELVVRWPEHSATLRFRDGDGHPAQLDELAGWVLRHRKAP